MEALRESSNKQVSRDDLFTLDSRFAEKVSFPSDSSDCWEWIACKDKNGYGKFAARGDGRKMVMPAHRYIYLLIHGMGKKHLIICHTCDNPSCVNPAHLFAGTHKDNSDDKIAKGRYVHAPQGGALNGNARLTVEQVAEIRTLIAEKKNNKQIAAIYGVTHQLISRIRLGKSWK